MSEQENAAPQQIKTGGTVAVVIGVGLIVVGALAIILPVAASVTSVVVVGWLMIIAAACAAGMAMSGGGWWKLLVAALYLAAGIFLIFDPREGALVLTLLLAAFFLVEGVLKTIAAFQVKPERGWGWALVSGIASIVLGGLIFAEWPSSAVWAIGLLVGINLMLTGFTMTAVSGAPAERPESRS